MPSMPLDGHGRCRIAAAENPGVLAVWLACSTWSYWYQLDTQKKSIAMKMEQAEQKNRELADVKARYLERQRASRKLQAARGRDRPAAHRTRTGRST